MLDQVFPPRDKVPQMRPAPTPEQETILAAVRGHLRNLLINALAGTGKTSTLVMIESAVDDVILCLAFNKRIADEMEKRFKPSNTVRTFNGLGHRVWGQAQGTRLTVDGKKCSKILTSIIRDMTNKKDQALAWEIFWEVLSAVNMARALGYIPEGVHSNDPPLIDQEGLANRLEEDLSSRGWNLVDEVLKRSIKASYDGLIDFNDQLYMPALFGGTFPRYPLVLVDEKQDLSPVNHKMLEKLNAGRYISVGDPFQSIYGFRGATTNGMAIGAKRFSMAEFDLSISFRCPEAIVENVRWRVPHFKAFNKGGAVHHLIGITVADFPDGCAIICRNNAPLFKMAFTLLQGGRSVSVAGSDIGPKLIGVMKRLGQADMPRAQVMDAIAKWRDDRLSKGNANAADMAQSMEIFAIRGNTLQQAVAWAEEILKQQGTIQLLTGHKAKGLEWDTVFHLDSHLIRGGDGDQEDNLRYVIDTRAKRTLYYLNSDAVAP